MQIDEFERFTRNAAYRNAYAVIASLSVLTATWWRIGSGEHVLPQRLATGDLAPTLAFLGWMLLVTTLPAALLAWSGRDEEEGAG